MYDVFISYKHEAYSREAESLMNILELDHQLKCFFDKRDSLWDLSDRDLKKRLRKSLKSAKYIVFFETYSKAFAYLVNAVGGQLSAVATGDRPSWQGGSGTGTSFSWQEWELRQGEAGRYLVLYQSTQPWVIQLGLGKTCEPYNELSQAANLIAAYVKRSV